MFNRAFFKLLSTEKVIIAMNWEPNANGITQILQLLNESQSTDTNIQRSVQQVL